jgi:23S rRNA (guanosine2251-2'-O)-methyltransferase
VSIHIRNPHSVLAALEVRPQDVLQITVPPALLERETDRELQLGRDAWAKVVQVAREKRVKIVASAGGGSGGQSKGKSQLHPQRGNAQRAPLAQQNGGGDDQAGGRVGAAEAIVKPRPGITAEELFEGAPKRAGGKGLWLALDSLTDPHNVGAIFRAASFFGVQGVLLTQERSAPLTGTVYDIACGGMEYVPFVLQTNLQRGFEVAKEAGLWILGTSEHAKGSFRTVERDRPWILVVGNEEKGMRRLTEEACDVVCQIPAVGDVTSLNVSVASGILISHLTG